MKKNIRRKSKDKFNLVVQQSLLKKSKQIYKYMKNLLIQWKTEDKKDFFCFEKDKAKNKIKIWNHCFFYYVY